MELLRFLLVGAVAVGADASVFALLALGLGVHPLAANCAAFLVGTTLDAWLCRRCVFRPSGKRLLTEYLQFALVSSMSLLISTAFLVLLLEGGLLRRLVAFPSRDMELGVAKGVAILLVTVFDYTAKRLLVFRRAGA
jgi:putative flippase GtrA